MKTRNMTLPELDVKKYHKYAWMNNIKNKWLRRIVFFFDAIGRAFAMFSERPEEQED